MSSLVDVVLFNPVAAGASDFVVSAARLGYLTPAAAGAVNGATYSYRAESADLAQWEVGRGVWNAGSDTLTRAVVLYNSLGNTAKINFTLVPQVGLVALATDVAALDGIAHFTNTTEATGVGSVYAARFEGGVEFAKKVFIAGAVAIGAITLANAQSALLITATQPTTPVTTQNAVSINITGAGSAAQANNAFFVSYLAGYTGSSLNRAGQFTNANLGTGSILIAAAGANIVTGNIGVNGAATGNTTGLNNGCIGIASNGDINVGVTGISQSVKNSAKNIGVVGSAINTGTSPVQIGGWFSLNQTTVPTVSAALIADNGAQTDAIFLARDNGTTVFSIVDGGNATLTGQLTAGSFVQGATSAGFISGIMGYHDANWGNLNKALSTGVQASWGWQNSAGTLLFLITDSGTASFPVNVASSSTTTGSLVTAGGIGIGGALNVAGVSSAAGLFSSSYVRAADGASIGWGALSATIVGNSSADVFVFYTASTERMRVANTQISISSTTASSSTTTGALIVGGGVGVGGSIYAGASIIGAGIYSTGAMKCSHPTAGLGYDTGAGGTVTQATNRTTGVTLNKSSGAITLFSQVNTAISQATAQSFTVTNSAVAATDTIIVSQKSGTDKYEIFVTNVAAGSFQITNYAVAGTTNEAPVFNFTVIKGVTS